MQQNEPPRGNASRLVWAPWSRSSLFTNAASAAAPSAAPLLPLAPCIPESDLNPSTTATEPATLAPSPCETEVRGATVLARKLRVRMPESPEEASTSDAQHSLAPMDTA